MTSTLCVNDILYWFFTNDIEGLPRDRHANALIAALDALELTDEQRITAMTCYFRTLAKPIEQNAW